MYKFINNPINNKNVYIKSKLGQQILKKYIIQLRGAADSNESPKPKPKPKKGGITPLNVKALAPTPAITPDTSHVPKATTKKGPNLTQLQAALDPKPKPAPAMTPDTIRVPKATAAQKGPNLTQLQAALDTKPKPAISEDQIIDALRREVIAFREEHNVLLEEKDKLLEKHLILVEQHKLLLKKHASLEKAHAELNKDYNDCCNIMEGNLYEGSRRPQHPDNLEEGGNAASETEPDTKKSGKKTAEDKRRLLAWGLSDPGRSVSGRSVSGNKTNKED